jgi:hypothetical protein
MRIRIGKTVYGACSVADNGINPANPSVCFVTASSVTDTLSVKYFF